MNKEKLREKILGLSDLTTEEKTALLELINRKKKYGLVWEDKPEAVEEQLRDQIPVLKEVKELAIVNDPDTDKYPDHILIEGDNLHALTALSYTHEGKIDVIYIDPPYNTGNKDFVYNDSYVDKEDSYRHSKWLSFMEKRLKLAKRMLSDRGVIFISIDDNEVAQLKLLCDDIFETSTDPSKSNCLGILVWSLGAGTQAGQFTRSHEYVLSYTRNKLLLENFKGGEGIIDHSALKKISKKNPPVRFSFKAGTSFNAPDNFELLGSWGGSEKTSLISGKMIAFKGKLLYDVELEAGFAMAKQMKNWFSGKETFDSKGQRVLEFYFNKSGVLHYKKERSICNPKTVLQDIGSTKSGSNQLTEIIGNNDSFDYPKPLELIQYLIGLFPNEITLLDFFAGSGTTLHATIQLNAEDRGNRQCILVTNNENNICTDVTYERNKRVIAGYTTPNGEEKAGRPENNLRYYKAEFVPRTKTLRNKRALLSAATDLLCIKEGNYAEKEMFGSIKCSEKGCRYFQQGKKQMLVIYDESLIAQIIDELSTMEVEGKIKIYVFAPGMYPFTDDFLDVYDKIELCSLPDAIYKTYQHILPQTASTVLLSEDAEDSMRQSERLLNSVPSSLFETLN
ncbi:MAG: site-specific DNA-methyltransferase [Bacteroidales bacterium]